MIREIIFLLREIERIGNVWFGEVKIEKFSFFINLVNFYSIFHSEAQDSIHNISSTKTKPVE